MEAANSSEATVIIYQALTMRLTVSVRACGCLGRLSKAGKHVWWVRWRFTREATGREVALVLLQDAVASKALDFPDTCSAPHPDVPAHQNAAISVRFSSACPWFTARFTFRSRSEIPKWSLK